MTQKLFSQGLGSPNLVFASARPGSPTRAVRVCLPGGIELQCRVCFVFYHLILDCWPPMPRSQLTSERDKMRKQTDKDGEPFQGGL